MPDEIQNEAQSEAQKKVDIPANVTVGQAVGYDPQNYKARTEKHADLLKRFSVPSYAAFEERLGSTFACAVVAYLLGDADHARVLGGVVIADLPHPVPGGVKAADGESDEPEATYKSGKLDVTVKHGFYFANGYKFAEKQKADIYALSLDNPKADASDDPVAKAADGEEKTALGADAEIGTADPTYQAQREKESSEVGQQG